MNELILKLLEKKREVLERLKKETDIGADNVRRAENRLANKREALRKRAGEVAQLQSLADAVRRGEIDQEEAEAQARKVYYNR
jgi:hypothetical protein